jgi:hypothetical protein
MTDYVEGFLSLPREAARGVQKDLYRQYGTTLNGLMREHDCDAEDYLRFVHDIDLGELAPDAGLKTALERLPGTAFCFHQWLRQSRRPHPGPASGMAGTVRRGLGHPHHGFQPKPQWQAYARRGGGRGVTCGQSRHVR